MEHPAMAHFSMGTYCRGCGAMWTRSEYIDEPKPKPWLAEAPKMTPIIVPAASAPPLALVEEPALQHVQPQVFEHGVMTQNISGHRELQTQHDMLRVLVSIDRMMKRQEGMLQTIVGQRLARMEDQLSNVQDQMEGANANGDLILPLIENMKGNMSQVCFILRKAVYKEEGDPYGYDGAIRTFNTNACECVACEEPNPFRIFVISDDEW
jgi:hypothetical protein